ncbi:sigma E protease regulator RseP [Bowmanella sp. JS7-9]|uniref:Zinc metalloprotease n=1 Tax=Pseudobowmanella zhangzhouensis TaxID=1537679 RepID=A0ABW1XK48_9ALTE|nr:sigma E protease regulator RseP [Bowmanella sp. JS7-9]TBX25629.1 zinc metallopeptidase RseP [Bowmanella sp. JS7-9]
MTGFIWSLMFFILAIGLLVAVHEWGHFWVARRCGVKVLRFSIGFGKPLWRTKDKSGTEFVIAAIPLGGYVQMLDERAEQVPEKDLPFAFNRQHVLKRMAIIAAGPLVNFIFAVFALMLMYLIGIYAAKPVVGDITPGSIAERAGLPVGSEIVSVGDQETHTWEAARLEVVHHKGDNQLTLEIIPPGGLDPQRVNLDIRQWDFDPEKESPFSSLGIELFTPKTTPVLALVEENSAASAAGLQVGDKIIGLDGTQIEDWGQIQGYLVSRPGQSVIMDVEREGNILTLSATLGAVNQGNKQVGYLGVAPTRDSWPEGMLSLQRLSPWSALIEGGVETWRYIRFTFSAIGKLLTGDFSLNNLSGPISIAQGAGASADIGLAYFLRFLAIVSVSLGVLNLLPVPVLDGGHLVFYVFEWISGKPVPERVQEIGYRLGGMLLFAMMSIAIFNDIARL